MFNTRTAVALAGILSGLALSGVGVAQAAGDSAPSCQRDSRGNTHCSQHSERRYTTEDGSKVVIEQSKSCTSYEKNRRVGVRPESQGKSSQGATMNCSNSHG